MSGNHNELVKKSLSEIIKKWNPLGVIEPALENEYDDIIPKIILSSKDTKSLYLLLEDYIINRLCIVDETKSSIYKNDLLNVVKEIQKGLNFTEDIL